MLYIISWSGNIRTYLEEADKVFLVKKLDMIWKLKKWGYVYSVVYQLLTVILAIFIMLPFLLHYFQVSWNQLVGMFIYFISLKTCLMLVKHHLRNIESKIKKLAIGSLLFVTFSWFNQLIYFIFEKEILLPIYLCSWGIFVIAIFLSLRILRKTSSTDNEILHEQERKTTMIQFIFMAAPELEKTTVSKRKKPIFFRRSKRIFKVRTPIKGLIELFLKVFIRNSSYISGYFVLINVTTAAIVSIPPLWIKVVIFLVFLIMMYSWLSVVWDKVFASNAIMKKYKQSDFYFTAKKRAVNGMYISAILFLLIFASVALTILSSMGLVYIT
ncbi:ABC transporter permease [Litchfieldia alkalitelluris]|uniref:ABC transporter permease n=1 Tax=Litchfieldia alkalitelluris TaxID=304268 RepID=UPI00195E5413|nr:ABC transporter permease [Litchfieldia alkalitelluris]